MRGYRSALALSVVWLAAASVSHASGQREEIGRRSFVTALSSLQPGDRLTVKETSGVLWEGEFHSLDVGRAAVVMTDAVPTSATGAGPRRDEVELSESSVESIVVRRKRSRIRGVAIGAAIGLGGAALASQGCCGNPDYGPETLFLIAAPILGGVGGAIGYFADSGLSGSEVLYTTEPPRSSFRWRVVPLVTREHKGALVSLSF